MFGREEFGGEQKGTELKQGKLYWGGGGGGGGGGLGVGVGWWLVVKV